MAKKPRNLSEEERAIWKQVADKTTPLHPERPVTETAQRALMPPKAPKIENPRKPFKIGQKAKPKGPGRDLAPSIRDEVASQPVAMDRKRFDRMKRGKLDPEARIDLHGLTLAQAHPALIRFILNAVADDRRLVLVITGKGKSRSEGGPIPERHGVLRHQVPHWLSSAPLRPHILQVTEAHVKHGGLGAYYVYLRKAR